MNDMIPFTLFQGLASNFDLLWENDHIFNFKQNEDVYVDGTMYTYPYFMILACNVNSQTDTITDVNACIIRSHSADSILLKNVTNQRIFTTYVKRTQIAVAPYYREVYGYHFRTVRHNLDGFHFYSNTADSAHAIPYRIYGIR